jgi:hypothetical protein
MLVDCKKANVATFENTREDLHDTVPDEVVADVPIETSDQADADRGHGKAHSVRQ